jgi:hypothetical protein
VIGNGVGLCVVSICAFGFIRIFELICPCFPWNFASRRNVNSCSVHLKKQSPSFLLVSDEDCASCVDIWLLIGFYKWRVKVVGFWKLGYVRCIFEVDNKGCRSLELGLCIVNFCLEAAN